MAIMGSCQFHPQNTLRIPSFQSSFSRTALQFFRHGSSRKLFFRAAHVSTTTSDFPQRKNPRKKINFPPLKSATGPISSRSSWLCNWNSPATRNGPKRPEPIFSYRTSDDFSGSDTEDGTGRSTGGSTMQKIVVRLKKFGYKDNLDEKEENSGEGMEKGSVEDIFRVEEGLLPNTRGGFSEKFPLGDGRSDREVKFPWERSVLNEQKISLDSRRRRTQAEISLPESEITRLRNLALRVKNKGKITGAGVTQQVVNAIHDKWASSEVVRLKIEGPPALNMRRMHEILERKTGGMVVWRSGTSVSLYRGVNYVNPAQRLKRNIIKKKEISDESLSDKSVQKNSSEFGPKDKTLSEVGYDDEMDGLLDSLGPRYVDWPGEGPLPVDADLLPGVVSGYRPPFRLLPYGTRSTLGTKEATAFRRLARGLPPHFALGRSRQHQGLAAAMIKLWEKSSIVKIALKRGVQLTTSERMAEELKRLTGGILVSRNKDYLVYYRGKDFLSPELTEALLEKEREAKALQDEEEQARLRASPALVERNADNIDEFRTAGTLQETLDADSRWGRKLEDDHKEKVMKEAEALRHANLLRKLENKLAFAEKKLSKGERALSKVEESLKPADRVEDPESLTDEERFMLRKLGLRMKAFLLLGRRGVFGGTVENMHLHWKYRELVKIIVKAPNIEEVKDIALSLEAESGGVLVSVDKRSKGYAVVVFRGRDYKRPQLLRPDNLLTKRKALARSIELQRREAFLRHISTMKTRVNQLRSEIKKMAAVKDQGDEELYNKLDSAYSTESEDEDSEEEEDDAYIESYGADESKGSVDNACSEANLHYDFEEEFEAESSEPINRPESASDKFRSYEKITEVG